MAQKKLTTKAKPKPITRKTSTRRRAVGATPPVRVVTSAHTRARPPERRAQFDLATPRVVLNPWHTKRDWRASRPKFFAAVVIIALVVGLYQLFSADLFFVGDLALSGNRILPRAEIDHAAGVRGWNLFFVEPGAVQAALEKLPEVKAARVTTILPNQVQIQIVERQPRFVWEVKGSKYWVDDDGIAMRVRGDSPNALQLRDDEGAAVKLGERVNSNAFNTAVSLVNAWQDGPRVFAWTRGHGLMVREQHGWIVYFGSASQMAEKLAALKIVTAQILQDKSNVNFIDLGSGLPYYQLAVSSPASNQTSNQPVAVNR